MLPEEAGRLGPPAYPFRSITNMPILKRIIPLCLALALAGCGGSGGSSTPAPDPGPTPPPTDANPAGHWFGTVTNDLSGITEEYVALADANGRFRFVSADSAVQFSGNFVITGNDLTGDAMAFADLGVVWMDTTSATPTALSGTITEEDTMAGTWTTVSGESGSFEFFYDPTFYFRASALSLLEGSWIAYDEFLNPAVTFTIAADGSFTGQNDQGCNSVGQFALIDPGFNLYEVQSTVSDCPIAGNYVGLALLADFFAPNDVLLFAVDNGSRALALGFEK